MNAEEFRNITGEVALYVYNEPILTGCKVLTTTRAKKALNKLINAGYNAKMMLLNNKIILIIKTKILTNEKTINFNPDSISIIRKRKRQVFVYRY